MGFHDRVSRAVTSRFSDGVLNEIEMNVIINTRLDLYRLWAVLGGL